MGMKLNSLQIEILRSVRDRIEHSNDGFDSYICYSIEFEIRDRRLEECNFLKNRILFWRKNYIFQKWCAIADELKRAVRRGISGHPTVGTWFHAKVEYIDINVDCRNCGNLGLYKQIRLAWLDRAIVTGELK